MAEAHRDRPPAFETADLPVRALVIGLAVLGAVLLAVVLSMAGLHGAWHAGQEAEAGRASLVALAPLPVPPPRLERNTALQRQALEAPARARLQRYGWADRAAGLAHVPIARAMEITAARGWDHAVAAPQQPPALPLRQEPQP